MGLFDFFKKKSGSSQSDSGSRGSADVKVYNEGDTGVMPDGNYIDDITYIRDIRHMKSGPWHQYDVIIAAQIYGWDMMLDWADYLSEADISHISEVTVAPIANAPGKAITDSYHKHGGKCRQTPELEREMGVLSIAGASAALHAPLKVVWFNQTKGLRFFTLIDDTALMRRYAETVVRHNFGTSDAMKLGKPIPEGQ